MKAAEEDIAVGLPLLSGLQIASTKGAIQTTNGVKYQIIGDDIQSVDVMLAPQQMMRTEPGTMIHMHSSLAPDIGTDGGCYQACLRTCCAGESFFRLLFQNKTSEDVAMGIAPPWPAKVLPFDMSVYRRLHVANGAFVGAVASNITFDIKTANSLGVACCGGQGLFFNEMSGDGVAFLCGGGALTEKTLGAGETLVIDTNSLLAWEPSVTLSVRRAGSVLMCCCGGEGLFLTELTGPGKVWIQPMPLTKLKRAVAPAAAGKGSGGGAASPVS